MAEPNPGFETQLFAFEKSPELGALRAALTSTPTPLKL